MGIAVRHNGDYQLLNGNEVGVLLLDFIADVYKRQHLYLYCSWCFCFNLDCNRNYSNYETSKIKKI